MAQPGMSVRVSGPLFRVNVSGVVKDALNEGIDQIALKGQALVQEQLYEGHGKVTSHLRRSIHGGLVRDLHGQIDAGLFQQGANLVYAGWVEGVSSRNRPRPGFPGYGMFQNAYRKLSNLDLRRFIVDKIVARLG